jgi:hypothetical protein
MPSSPTGRARCWSWISHEAAEIARAGGLQVVMDRCCKIEHARFFGGLRTIGLNTGVVTSRLAMRLPEG